MDDWPPHLSPAERAALAEFVASARAALGDALLDVRLFGSRARGEGHAESDLDVVLVVTSEGPARRREAYDLAFDAMLAHGPLNVPLVIDAERLEELRGRERRSARDIDRDGVRR